MARPPTGGVVERRGKRGTTYALRFRAYKERQYETLGVAGGPCTRCGATLTDAHAAEELENVLADVRRGLWQPPRPAPAVEPPQAEPTFHEFASEWFAAKKAEGLAPRTLTDYEWALSYHLLPWFKTHRLSEITTREVDRYKTFKASEGVLSPAIVNKTITRLAQILALAVEYDLLPANPAVGRRRRLKADKPRRGFVQPEQLMALLEASEKRLHKRGRPLLSTLAGAGLRIGEALALERRHVNLARGTLVVERSKTDAGVRVVDLTPALRDELALWLDRSPFKRPTDPVFPTLKGAVDNRQNVRRRLLVPAISDANAELAKAGIPPIGDVGLHGLRRTYATLRCVVGDDPVYTSAQLGHTDPTFSMRVYAQASKHREKLTKTEREAFEQAVEWARMGTTEPIVAPPAPATAAPENEETRGFQRVS